MKENYPKAYTEVLEILKFMPQYDIEKIPREIIEMMKNKKDNTHQFSIRITDDFSKLNILDETEAIFINFYRDYWATPEQRDKIIAKQNYDIQAFEDRKKEKYNADNLFKKTQTFKEINIDEKNNNLPIEHKEKFFIQFVNFIKRLLSFHENGIFDDNDNEIANNIYKKVTIPDENKQSKKKNKDTRFKNKGNF